MSLRACFILHECFPLMTRPRILPLQEKPKLLEPIGRSAATKALYGALRRIVAEEPLTQSKSAVFQKPSRKVRSRKRHRENRPVEAQASAGRQAVLPGSAKYEIFLT